MSIIPEYLSCGKLANVFTSKRFLSIENLSCSDDVSYLWFCDSSKKLMIKSVTADSISTSNPNFDMRWEIQMQHVVHGPILHLPRYNYDLPIDHVIGELEVTDTDGGKVKVVQVLITHGTKHLPVQVSQLGGSDSLEKTLLYFVESSSFSSANSAEVDQINISFKILANGLIS
ncbi:hypothetical protein BKA56DRAFT_616702 [Ilyonectria sp. MPI-CAGE-AT-0026]|nr:hypothetical protein BKA56DRAFT_616702 [Ilyonectria sp. MPI-CAGE-AT-0026]